jgi:hypothetical protein
MGDQQRMKCEDSKEGMQTFCLSPQIANPQILGTIPTETEVCQSLKFGHHGWFGKI